MCPLRLILLFLSASLAGFFVIRNLKSTPGITDDDDGGDSTNPLEADASSQLPLSKKVCSAIGLGFWVFVDMASGKYLWRNLASAKQNQL